MLGFTPENVSNIVDVDRYVSFFLNTVIMFGIGFLLPFALLLNLAGVLPAKTLISAWRWIPLGTFFAAVATPDGNPFTMTMLAADHAAADRRDGHRLVQRPPQGPRGGGRPDPRRPDLVPG
ncbi:MAG: twin-arginine translocase subunit TatC [Candidatus Nanopelagicales bacterium]